MHSKGNSMDFISWTYIEEKEFGMIGILLCDCKQFIAAVGVDLQALRTFEA